MNLKFVKQWEENKEVLDKWFTETKMYYEYKDIVKKLFELVLSPNSDYTESFDVEKITVIDDGDYQGTQLFIIPYQTYQPSFDEYAITSVGYGSCSGCDTLLSICGYNQELPNKKQLKGLMTLALHLVQNAKEFSDFKESGDK